MSKLNRGNSHISIGEYMTQAGWPLVGRIRSVVGYQDKEIQPITVREMEQYNWDSPYNTDECNSHIEYANKNRFYQWLYILVGHPFRSAKVYPVVSTLDNPELLRSSTHCRFDVTAVADGEGAKRKWIQGWQQLRGSFEPMRKSLKGLTKIFSRYKSSIEVVDNDLTSFLNGTGNVVEGLTQLVLVPIFLLFRLLKNLGLLFRHPFTGASYSNLFVRTARDIGYSITWVIEGSLEIVQGLLRIALQVPKWFIQMPIRGIRTAVSGYVSFSENTGTQALVLLAHESVKTALTEKVKADGGVSYYEDSATNAFDEFIANIDKKKTTIKNHSWKNLQKIMAGLNILPKLYEGTWPEFYRAAMAKDNAPDFKGLIEECYNLKPKVSHDRNNKDYQDARAQIIEVLTAGLQQRYLQHLQQTVTVAEAGTIFAELAFKAMRAENLKGQMVDNGRYSQLLIGSETTSVKTAQDVLQSFDSNLAKFDVF